MEINEITGKIIEAAITVHSTLGPGLFERVYSQCLARELRRQELSFDSEVPLALDYDGQHFKMGYKIDMIVESQVIVELKAIERITSLHRSQVITYLKLAHKQVGLLINFNCTYLMNGIHRLVNNYDGPKPQRCEDKAHDTKTPATPNNPSGHLLQP